MIALEFSLLKKIIYGVYIKIFQRKLVKDCAVNKEIIFQLL